MPPGGRPRAVASSKAIRQQIGASGALRAAQEVGAALHGRPESLRHVGAALTSGLAGCAQVQRHLWHPKLGYAAVLGVCDCDTRAGEGHSVYSDCLALLGRRWAPPGASFVHDSGRRVPSLYAGRLRPN